MNAIRSDKSIPATKQRSPLDLEQAQEFWVREADRWDGTSGRFGDAMLEAAELEPGQRGARRRLRSGQHNDRGCAARGARRATRSASTSPARRSSLLASVPSPPAWTASASSRRMPRCIRSSLGPSMP